MKMKPFCLWQLEMWQGLLLALVAAAIFCFYMFIVTSLDEIRTCGYRMCHEDSRSVERS
jgi:hypothetical protein